MSSPADAAREGTSPRKQNTIIVGAGIAGLACARRLHDANRPFLIISERVGGRIHQSGDGAVNLGAYYVRADYTNVNRHVDLGRRIDRLSVQRHDAGNTYGLWNGRLLLHLPQAVRFLRLLIRFRRHYDHLKQRCSIAGQAAAIRSDPWLEQLYHQPAPDFVDQHRLGELARWYLAPGLHGTVFASLQDITAFALLLGALPVLIPAHEFTLRLDRLADGFAGTIVADTVNRISAQRAGYRVETLASGTFIADQVVIATPTDAAKKLLGLSAGKQPVAAHMFQVAGPLRDPYDQADFHLFAEDDATLAIAQQADGSVLFCSRQDHPDFGLYFKAWRVMDHKHWNPAFNLIGDDILECEQGPNLFLIGDHNIVGLEDAYLTGLFAANQIIARTRAPEPAPTGRPMVASKQPA
ncbi:MAG: FAD-dependent oxidoreductase [Acidimicrobiia bacterium]|nr:FAD-dependent oxidoreductase [Acidimicrobiia bacterium]